MYVFPHSNIKFPFCERWVWLGKIFFLLHDFEIWILYLDMLNKKAPFLPKPYISISSCMLLRQLYDWRCNPDLVEYIINRRIFVELRGSSVSIWCNGQKIFQFVSQRFLWYHCSRKLYCLNDTTYNWLKTAKKLWITFNNNMMMVWK